ncbi:uncharacterized protein METZ01_LOCUS94949, partial [marine metagenome]
GRPDRARRLRGRGGPGTGRGGPLWGRAPGEPGRRRGRCHVRRVVVGPPVRTDPGGGLPIGDGASGCSDRRGRRGGRVGHDQWSPGVAPPSAGAVGESHAAPVRQPRGLWQYDGNSSM